MLRAFIKRRIFGTLQFSFLGFKFAWKHEEAFRIELMCFAVLVPLSIWLGENGLSRAILIFPCFVVLIVELLNSAIEATIDLCSPELHPLAGAAKDMGSAAVFLSLLMIPAVWILVLM